MQVKVQTVVDSDKITVATLLHDQYQLGAEHCGVRKITEDVVRLKDQAIRDALVELGWTPPGNATDQEALQSRSDAWSAVFQKLCELRPRFHNYTPGACGKDVALNLITKLAEDAAKWEDLQEFLEANDGKA